MKPEDIKRDDPKGIPVLEEIHLASRSDIAFWLKEIAYQLAVMNEKREHVLYVNVDNGDAR